MTKLNLSNTGIKSELQDRLLQHFGLQFSEEISDSDIGEASSAVKRMVVEHVKFFCCVIHKIQYLSFLVMVYHRLGTGYRSLKTLRWLALALGWSMQQSRDKVL